MIHIIPMHSFTTASVVLLAGGLVCGGCKAATVTALGVCVADGSVSVPVTDGAGDDPESFFQAQVQPVLESACANCHEDGSGLGPEFLTPDDYYRSVRMSGLVVAGAPDDSLLLTYPQLRAHPTSWPNAAAIQAVRSWIELEENAPEAIPPLDLKPESEATPVLLGGETNQIRLDPGNLPGAILTFTASRSGAGIQLQGVQWRGGEKGIAASGPRFVVTNEASEKTIQGNPFVAGDIRVDTGQTVPATSAAVNLPSFPEGALLSVQFDALGPMP